jgi:hypothetical protein
MKVLIVLISLIALLISQSNGCETEPVNCFQPPCEATPCDVEGATCVDDYCGGCNAIWTDAEGNPVCGTVTVDCSTVKCAAAQCQDGEVAVVPEGKCCETCQKETVDCAAVSCLAVECQEGQYIVTPEGECCPQCADQPAECAQMECAEPLCIEGTLPTYVEGECCQQCKPAEMDCSTVRCASPNCGKDQVAFQPEGQCCLQCKEGCDEVQCFADPCSVSECDVKGAICTSNYCGGCNAIWTLDGELVECNKEVGTDDERTVIFTPIGDTSVEDLIEKIENYMIERGIEFEVIEQGYDMEGKPTVVVVFTTKTDAEVASRSILEEGNPDFIIAEEQDEDSASILVGLALILVLLF